MKHGLDDSKNSDKNFGVVLLHEIPAILQSEKNTVIVLFWLTEFSWELLSN